MLGKQRKIIKLVGGLGNQMFQYGFALCLSKKINTKVVLDLSWFEDVKTHKNVTARPFELDTFNLNYETATKDELAQVEYPQERTKSQKFLGDVLKIEKYKLSGNAIVKKSHKFDKNLLKEQDFVYYDGYFQDERYFKDVRDELLKCFTSSIPLDKKNRTALDEIQKTNSVSVHIRRGDYLTLESAKNFHGVCPLEYYQRAIEYISKRVKNPHFFLFSDDIGWVVENLKLEYPYTIIDFNQDKGWLDLNLMKQCRHNIIANSSFSWWGAWLNENPKNIIIAPKNWFAQKIKSGIIPSRWVKL